MLIIASSDSPFGSAGMREAGGGGGTEGGGTSMACCGSGEKDEEG